MTEDIQLCEDCGKEVESKDIAKCAYCGWDGLCPKCIERHRVEGCE